jgi:hypothetical protein
LLLMSAFPSRSNEPFLPGHWLSWHSWRWKALCCGFHKRLKQTKPVSCRITASVPYVCRDGLTALPGYRLLWMCGCGGARVGTSNSLAMKMLFIVRQFFFLQIFYRIMGFLGS